VQVNWEGWKLKTLLDFLGMAGKENRYYAFYSRDGMYFESLSHKEAMDDRALVVYGMNGKDLPHDYGGPVRLAIPFLQGYKSVKWLSGIRAFKTDPLGIKVLLEQSKTGRLAPAWKNKYGLGPLEGRVRAPGYPKASE
jgi:DMSO/TMAO reductase YedYZ molybdopterin-dependent catalytic subunit